LRNVPPFILFFDPPPEGDGYPIKHAEARSFVSEPGSPGLIGQAPEFWRSREKTGSIFRGEDVVT